jgi:hypothetical protein
MARSTPSIEELLVSMGALDPQQLQAARGHAQQWGIPLYDAVVERRFCSREDVLRGFSVLTGYPVSNLDAEPLDPTLAALVPLRVAEQHRAVPLRLSGRRSEVIEVAFAFPVAMAAIDAAQAVSRKSRVAVHLSTPEAVDRAIGRLYRNESVPAPAAPTPVVNGRAVAVENEATFDFGQTPSLSSTGRPVRLFGFHAAAMDAVKAMLERGGVAADPIDDAALELLDPDEVLISTTLGLRTVLGPAARLKVKLIVCGTEEEGDPEDAKALGARLYLQPPLSTEQLVAAIGRVRAAAKRR